MMLVYGLTIIITGMWIIKSVIRRKLEIRWTPLDIPILLFFISQIISTVISLDPHVSLWGYYSRFNGGLFSTISYILLYYAFVNNFPKSKILTLLKITIISAVLVASYGILEHFGIDRDLWVQDVQNRVFSSLGQPNWLAAYLAILIPVALGLGLNNISNQIFNSESKIQSSSRFNRDKVQNLNLKFLNIGLPASPAGGLVYWVIGLLFYLALIFTKSRSGFIGFWIAGGIFWILFLLKFKQNFIKWFLIFNFLLLTFNFFFGTPFSQLNRFTFTGLINNYSPTIATQQPVKPSGDSIIEVGITESGTIRKIVWQGAFDIIRHYPLFGSGVETFAFSYYRFRPAEHNMTSEWDFLYNKAHNEYLNYAATTGLFGLGSYLLIILVFIGWNINRIKNQELGIGNNKYENKLLIHNSYFLIPFLFSGWLSILVTNFFGFSVVIVQLFLFLIPAISFVLTNETDSPSIFLGTSRQQITRLAVGQADNSKISSFQYISIFTVLFVICYLLFVICKLWYADVIFAAGYNASRQQDYTTSYKNLKRAISLNDREPFYYDEFSFPSATLALALFEDKQTTLSAQLTEESILTSDMAISISPNNVNFWKTRTRVFYSLSQMDEKYLPKAAESLEQSKILSPTDPKVRYNLALIYDKLGKTKEAIDELILTTRLKPDYRDAYYALAFLYDKKKEKTKAKEALEFIVTRIATDDAEAMKKLNEIK